jgi:hypothetical protein
MKRREQGPAALPRATPLAHNGPMRRRDLLPLAGVLALWLAAVALVGVGGEFPLSDDWAYAHAVRALCEGRGLDLLPWTGASLLAQAAYGAVTCRLVGFSYESLRWTTLAWSAVGIVSTWALLREAGAASRVAAAGAATVAFTPVWFNLSFTFMTDVPFAASATLAAALYARGLRLVSRRTLLVASAFAAFSFLIRQHGVFPAIAAASAALLAAPASVRSVDATGSSERVRTPRARFGDAVAASALPLLAAALYVAWVASGVGVPLALHNKVHEAATTSYLRIGNAAFRGIVTVGVMLVPWAVLTRSTREDPREGRRVALCGAVLGIAALFLFVREGATMFYLPNVLYDFGLGAVTLRDAFFLALPSLPSGGLMLRIPLTALAVFASAVLLVRLSAGVSRLREPVPAFCLLALALLGMGALAQSAYFLDRYLLAMLPLTEAGIVALSRELRLGAGFAVALAVSALYAIGGTHDYMAWNRARWSLLADLEARGVAAERIDGGVEYNAERLAARLGSAPTDAEAKRGQSQGVKSWWWVVDDEWILAFGPLEGYAIADSARFARWLPPGEGRVLELHRESSAAQRPAGQTDPAVPADQTDPAVPAGHADPAVPAEH